MVVAAFLDAARVPFPEGVLLLVQQPDEQHCRGQQQEERGPNQAAARDHQAVRFAPAEEGRREADARQVRACCEVPAVAAPNVFIRRIHGPLSNAQQYEQEGQLPRHDERVDAAS